MLDAEIREELRKAQEFADKIQILPYDQVQKALDEAAVKTAKETARWLFEKTEQLVVNT